MKLLQKWKKLQRKVKKNPKWVTVFQTTDEYLVHIYKLKLEDNNIPVSIFNQIDSSYNAFGYIYLSVPLKDQKNALELINNENE